MSMDQSVTTLKALADRSRLRIVLALSNHEELCACQITGLLQATGATVSRHLAVLQRAGLVKRRRQGRWIWYRLAPRRSHQTLLTWVQRKSSRDVQLAADRQALASILSVAPADYCRLKRGASNGAATEGTG